MKKFTIKLNKEEIKMCQGAQDWLNGGLILWTSEHDLLARILRQIVNQTKTEQNPPEDPDEPRWISDHEKP